jgi:hypothetical protein
MNSTDIIISIDLSIYEKQTNFQMYLDRAQREDRFECSIDMKEVAYEAEMPLVAQGGMETSLFQTLFKAVAHKVVGVSVDEQRKTLSIVLNTLESIPLALQDISQASTNSQLVGSFIRAYKMFSRSSICETVFENYDWIISMVRDVMTHTADAASSILDAQGATFDQGLKYAKSALHNYSSIRSSAIVTKITDLFKYLLCFGVFKSIGLKFDRFNYDNYAIKSLKKTHSSIEDFVFAMLQDIVWFIERSQQAIELGSFDPFLHSADSYHGWAVSAVRVLEDAAKVSTCDALICEKATEHTEDERLKCVKCQRFSGLDEHSFLQRLTECIEQGESMCKYAESALDKVRIQTTLRELRLVEARVLSKKNAMRPREPPYSLQIFGDSSVGKSMFLSMCFQHFGKVHGKDISPRNKYIRNPIDKFWSSWSPSCWCIVLDDVGSISPQAVPMDLAQSEVIPLKNSIPMIANMAAVEDKGVYAIRPDLVMITSNLEHMGIESYFSYPLAARRRFPTMITLEVKDECARRGTRMLDESRVMYDEAGFQNCWVISVSQLKVTHKSERIGDLPDYSMEVVHKFTESQDFLAWFANDSMRYRQNMHSATNTESVMAKIEICDTCFRASKNCECAPRVQSDFEESYSADDEASGFLISDLEEWMGNIDNQPLVVDPLGPHQEEMIFMCPTERDEPQVFSHAIVERASRGWIEDVAGIAADTRDLMYSIAKMGAEKAKKTLCGFSDAFISEACSTYYCYQKDKFITWISELGNKVRKHAAPLIAGFCAILIGAWGVWKAFSSSAKYLSEDEIPWFGQFESVGVLGKTKFATTLSSRNMAEWNGNDLELMRQWFKDDGCAEADDLKLKHLMKLKKAFQRNSQAHFAPNAQGNNQSVQEELASWDKDEKQSPWVKDEFILNDFQVPNKAKGWAQLERHTVEKKISENLFHGVVVIGQDASIKHMPFTSWCVAGHIYATCAHCLPHTETMKCSLNNKLPCDHIVPTFEFTLCQKDIWRHPTKDLALFYCPYAPRADLRGLLPLNSVDGLRCDGFYLHCRAHQQPEVQNLKCLHTCDQAVRFADRVEHIPSWKALAQKETISGDCGSPMVAMTPQGPLIVGIHQTIELGTLNVSSFRIEASDFSQINSYFGTQVQCGVPSNLNDVGPLHHKSVLRWPRVGHGTVFGSTTRGAWRQAPKTRVCDSYIRDAAEAEGFVKRCGAPVMNGPEVWFKNVEPTLTGTCEFRRDRMRECSESFVNHILKEIPLDVLKKELIKLDPKTTVNGYPGIRFLDSIDRNTSMGHPYRKSKKHFLVPVEADEVYSDAVEYVPEVMSEVERIRECYRRGERAMPVYVMSLKDEAIKQSKIDAKKTRGFLGGPATHQFVVREQLLTMFRLIQTHPIVFCSAVGTNPRSCQWKHFYEHLTQFGKDRMIAGDFAMYDKRMSSMVMMEAFHVFERLFEVAGRSEEDLAMLRGIAADICFPLIDVQGDIVQMDGSNPSGWAGTVILNCIVNVLYQMYIFNEDKPIDVSLDSFWELVAALTYGDDNAIGVSASAPWFSHTSLATGLAKFGVVYTMADKETASIPYIHIDEVSFLKRLFVVDGEKVRCPLEWASLDKMMTTSVASKSISPQAQAVQVMTSAMREAHDHGQQVFDETVGKMKRIIEKKDLQAYVEPSTFATWNELNDSYVAACKSCKECNPPRE